MFAEGSYGKTWGHFLGGQEKEVLQPENALYLKKSLSCQWALFGNRWWTGSQNLFMNNTIQKECAPNAHTVVSTVTTADPSGGVRWTVRWLKIKAHICRHCHPAGTWAGPYMPRVGVSSYSAISANCKTPTIKNKCSSSAKRLPFALFFTTNLLWNSIDLISKIFLSLCWKSTNLW